MLISAAANWAISSYLYRVAKATNSIALEADALHLRTDVYTSAGVVVGLGLIYFTGWSIVDPLVAIGVALLIIKASVGLTRVAFMPLLDTALPEQEEMVVRGILEGYQKKGKLSGFHKLRTRQAGAERHVDVHLVLPGSQDLLSVHDLTESIEGDIKAQLDNATVVIHMEPCCSETGKNCSSCETYLEMAKQDPGDKSRE
jgi:cation diffusion facilitator family transporter